MTKDQARAIVEAVAGCEPIVRYIPDDPEAIRSWVLSHSMAAVSQLLLIAIATLAQETT